MDALLLRDVELAEGCPTKAGLPVAYRDGKGNWTGGYGHLLGPGDWNGYTFGWSMVDEWLQDDLAAAAHQAQTLPEWGALDTPCRENALIECVFNLGLGHWTTEFPLTRRAMGIKDWQGTHDNLLRSPDWIKDVGLARVTRLAQYFLTGTYP